MQCEESLPGLQLHRLEDGAALFSALERRHGLASTEGESIEQLIRSPHHNQKARVGGAALRAALREGYRAHRPQGARFPELRSDMLHHDPEVGALVRICYAADYGAYGHLYPSG